MTDHILSEAISNVSPSGLGNIAGTLFQVVAFAIIAFFVGIVCMLLVKTYLDRQKYNYRVNIYYQEPGSKVPIFKQDIGGIFIKGEIKRFYLKKNQVGLDPDNVPFMFTSGGSKLVTLWQTGVKSFRYALPSINYNPGFTIKVGEEDVNWAIATYNEWKARHETQNFIQKYGFMILWGLTVMGTVALFWIVAQKFDILAEAVDVLKGIGTGTIIS